MQRQKQRQHLHCWTWQRVWLPFYLTEFQRPAPGAEGSCTWDPTCGDISVQGIFTVEQT